MTSGLITSFLGEGVAASRPADPDVGNAIAFWWSTDTDEMSAWLENAWVEDVFGTGGALLVANNLSDLANAATARTNLGLGSLAVLSNLDLNDLGDVDTTGVADGDVLTYDSGTGDWLPVAPSAGAGGDWEFISVQTASASGTIDFTGIVADDWDFLMIEALNVVSSTDNVDLWLRVGTGAGPTYATGASDYSFAKHGVHGTTGTGAGFTAADTSFDAMQFPMTGISNVSGEAQSGALTIGGLSTGTYCHASGLGGGFKADNGHVVCQVAGRYNATTAITALRVMASTGNIASGKFVLRGRPAA